MSAEEPKFNFDEGFQREVVALIIRDPEFNLRTDGLVVPGYFENELNASLAALFMEYFQKYRTTPKNKGTVAEILKSGITRKIIRKEFIPDLPDVLKELQELKVEDRDFVADRVAAFARHQALRKAVISSVDLMEKGKFDEVEQLVRAANEVGKNEGVESYDYFARAPERTQTRKDRMSGKVPVTGIPSGYNDLDELLFHRGWGRKELSLYMAGPKSGKTMALIDHARAASFNGYNVMYVTLEVSAAIIAERLDANISEVPLGALAVNADEVQRRVQALKPTTGRLVVHEFPTGTLQPKGLSRLINHYKSLGQTFDMVVVDYADLMAPNVRSQNPMENSKNIYIDLRAIAQTENLAILSATQTNRTGFQQAVQKMEHVADDISKVRIADLIISINATDEEKAAREARLYFVASRNQEDGVSIRIKTDLERAKLISKVVGRE